MSNLPTDVHSALRAAVHELVDPVERKILRETGNATTHTAPSLLDQLRDATSHSGETGAGRGGGARLPVDAAAVDALLEITSSASDLHDRATMHSTLTIEQHIRRIAELAEQWTDTDAISWVVQHLQLWHTTIDAVLNPTRRTHLVGACPACKARMVFRELPTGTERVQTPALAIGRLSDGTIIGCTCGACGAHWHRNQLEHLALVLKSDRPTPPPSDDQHPSNMALPAAGDPSTPQYGPRIAYDRCTLTELLTEHCAHCRVSRLDKPA